MIRISQLAASVKPSATLAAGAKARQLKAAGVKVFDFSLGEPDFNTPKHICDAAEKAALGGPDALHADERHRRGEGGDRAAGTRSSTASSSRPENVIVSNGAKHSIHNALAATVGPGDEVIIPTPYWVSYTDLVQHDRGDGRARADDARERLQDDARAAQGRRSRRRPRLLMLNSPCNPTGTVYTRAELEALVDTLVQNSDAAILSDEIYEQLIYGVREADLRRDAAAGLKDRTITISGASKSYAMTGWRMGWTIGPAPLVKAMDTIQSQETSCPSSVSQAALVAALDGPQECVAEMRKEFAARRELTWTLLGAIPGVKLPGRGRRVLRLLRRVGVLRQDVRRQAGDGLARVL